MTRQTIRTCLLFGLLLIPALAFTAQSAFAASVLPDHVHTKVADSIDDRLDASDAMTVSSANATGTQVSVKLEFDKAYSGPVSLFGYYRDGTQIAQSDSVNVSGADDQKQVVIFNFPQNVDLARMDVLVLAGPEGIGATDVTHKTLGQEIRDAVRDIVN